MNHLEAMFGGYVAEQIVFGRVTTGPSDDLKRIVEVSRSMIEDYGMGSQLIAHVHGNAKESLSEEARKVRDREQQALIDEAQTGARLLLTEYRDMLDAIAGRLLEQETLDRKEIEAIINEALARSGKSLPGPVDEPGRMVSLNGRPKTHTGRFERAASNGDSPAAGPELDAPAPTELPD